MLAKCLYPFPYVEPLHFDPAPASSSQDGGSGFSQKGRLRLHKTAQGSSCNQKKIADRSPKTSKLLPNGWQGHLTNCNKMLTRPPKNTEKLSHPCVHISQNDEAIKRVQIYLTNFNKTAIITNFSLHFFCFYWKMFPSWIRIRILNADPDTGEN